MNAAIYSEYSVARLPYRASEFLDDGFAYLCEFSNGTVKVGKTKAPSTRMAQHTADAVRFGVRIDRLWLSPEHRAYAETEKALIRAATGLGVLVSGFEYFGGCTISEILAALGDQAYDRSTEGGKVFDAMDQDEIHTGYVYTSEVADIFKVSVRTVHRMVKAGRISPVVRGAGRTSSMLFSRTAVEKEAAKLPDAA